MTRVAVLGMGRMGRAIATRLAAGGHDTVVWNRTSGRAGEALEAGAREAPSLPVAVDGVQVAITMLADDDAVRAVAAELRDSLGPEAVFVDSSTSSPALAAELAGRFPRFAAMPVLGAPGLVADGRAGYLLGSPPDTAARVEPLLPALSDNVHRYQRPEVASAAKLASNLMLLAEIVALAESLAVGRAGGLSDPELADLLGTSPMLAPGVANRFEAVVDGSGPVWWTTTLGAKDIGLCLDLAASAGRQLPMADAAGGVYRHAMSAGLADEDIAVVSRLYRS